MGTGTGRQTTGDRVALDYDTTTDSQTVQTVHDVPTGGRALRLSQRGSTLTPWGLGQSTSRAVVESTLKTRRAGTSISREGGYTLTGKLGFLLRQWRGKGGRISGCSSTLTTTHSPRDFPHILEIPLPYRRLISLSLPAHPPCSSLGPSRPSQPTTSQYLRPGHPWQEVRPRWLSRTRPVTGPHTNLFQGDLRKDRLSPNLSPTPSSCHPPH